jgi:hypothetical protein
MYKPNVKGGMDLRPICTNVSRRVRDDIQTTDDYSSLSFPGSTNCLIASSCPGLVIINGQNQSCKRVGTS